MSRRGSRRWVSPLDPQYFDAVNALAAVDGTREYPDAAGESLVAKLYGVSVKKLRDDVAARSSLVRTPV